MVLIKEGIRNFQKFCGVCRNYYIVDKIPNGIILVDKIEVVLVGGYLKLQIKYPN
jgi:hypothetical protein